VSDITVFSGSAHHAFAEEVCAILGTPVAPSRTTRFSNDCLQVQLRDNCRKRDVFIIQPLVPPVQENLVELLLMIDAARGASAAQITVIPHFAYARSDKKDAPRISIGGRLVADLISTAGATRVLTMALHAEQVHGFFSVPVDHLSALPVLAAHFRQTMDLSNAVVVSPDFGNAKQAGSFSRRLGIGMAAGSKQRQGDDTVIIDTIVGDVQGRDVIVLDDEIATGGSTVTLIEKIKEYDVKSIRVACTHGLFTGRAAERLNACSGITEVVATNTVPPCPNVERLTVLSVAPLFAEAIRRIHSGESISGLFSAEDTYGD